MLLYSLIYQYKVKPLPQNEQFSEFAGAIATVVVFTETDDQGKARSREFLEMNHWEITEPLRVMFVCPEQIKNLDSGLKKVYRQAELYGIAASYDGWSHHPHRS